MAAKAPPPKAPPGGAQSLGAPNQSLHIGNLPDKINKNDMRRALYMLFSTYGPVLDVNVMRTTKMRGQAHIAYRDIQTSTQALRSLQGFEFFGKELRISYGKGKSNTIAKLDGTFRIPVTAIAPEPSNETQISIFAAPPGGAAAKTVGDVTMADGEKEPHGLKRKAGEEDEDVPMEEDEDDDAMAMDESDDDD